MNFMQHFRVAIIFARKFSDITGNMGNVDASEALLVQLLLTLFVSTNCTAENNFHIRI